MTQLTPRARRLSRSISVARAARTASGSRIATNARTAAIGCPSGGSRPGGAGGADPGPPARGLPLHRPAVTREVEALGRHAGANADPIKTVSTGLVGVPPSGPAMPVIASAQSLPLTRRTPAAIASAHGALTAPVSLAAPRTVRPAAPPWPDWSRPSHPARNSGDEPGTLGEAVAQQTAGAGFGHGQGQPDRSASRRPTTRSSEDSSRP